MSDYLVRLSRNRTARTIIQTLRLPVPLPQSLARRKGPWESEPLKGQMVYAALSENGPVSAAIRQTLSGMGADLWARGGATQAPENTRPSALIYDGTGLDRPESLKDLYEFVHAHIGRVGSCGRVLVLVRPPESADDPVCRAARRAVEGFIRSLGKEAGRKGTTTQTVYVEEGAEERLEPVLRFLLSKGSAYITGQPVHVTTRASYAPVRKYVRPLEDKVALVTGAARGIGEATARALAREGARVIVMDRPAEMDTARKVAESIQGTALACDITDEKAVAAIMEHVGAHYSGLDIVVHNAGITRDKTLKNMRPEQWDMVANVNLIGLVRTNESLLEHVRDGGRIIAMSSVGGIAGNAGQTNYGCTKAGVIGYVQGLAPRVSSRGITVNAVAPGFIETQMTAAMPLGTREVARRLCSLIQGGLPEDIAETITFLASPDAAGITGEVVRVCGGNFIGA